MKLSRRLIPAIAMLMVSAVLMSTASFAWFSMNTKVTATGLSLTVEAPTASLLISQNDSTGFGSTIALANHNDNMTSSEDGEPYTIDPVTDDTSNKKFYKLTADGMALVDQAGTVSNKELTNEKYYIEATTTDVYIDTFYLKLDDASKAQKDIYLTAKYADGVATTAIKSAFHIIVFVGDTRVGEFDMGNATNKIDKLCTLTGNAAATAVTIYAFLDGEDPQCMNSNISTDFTATINLELGIVTE